MLSFTASLTHITSKISLLNMGNSSNLSYYVVWTMIFFLLFPTIINCIDGIMFNVLAASAVDNGF
jgi:hypothetical protein